jgi:hypothetical protein
MQNIVCFFYAPSVMAFLLRHPSWPFYCAIRHDLFNCAIRHSLFICGCRHGLFAQMPAGSRIVIPLWIEAV